LPIVECGFPAGFPSATPSLSPADALVFFGPTIQVDIGFDPTAFAQAGAALPAAPNAPQQPIAPMQNVLALVDTGATESCIDEDLATQLQLPLVDQQVTGGVGGQTTLNMYLATVQIPGLRTGQYGRFSGARLAAGGSPHRAILGRTLLRGTIMIYDGQAGSVKLVR
jgi:predicted aspartyl protease